MEQRNGNVGFMHWLFAACMVEPKIYDGHGHHIVSARMKW